MSRGAAETDGGPEPGSDARHVTGGRVADLRRAFDRAFASAPPGEPEEHDDLLAIRVAGEPYALRVGEIAGVEACRGIVPLPSRASGLLGLAGIGGGLVPVYGLAALLGHAGPREEVRWLVLCGGGEPVGLGLAQLEGWLRVLRSELSEPAGGEAQHAPLHGLVRAGGTARPVISIPEVLQTLKARAGGAGPSKEQ